MTNELELSENILSLTEIFERSESGGVSISVARLSELGGSSGVGSEFVFNKEGHIITNNHVVENAKKYLLLLLMEFLTVHSL